uniref:Uncharacterized protein n=1 Tax=Romanomermis culicivorax TaxID=13658 RepID=A0A915IYZ4_ROMCU
MPPPTMILPIHNVQGEERMDIPRIWTGTQPPQRPPSTGNPDYISPLKRETGIGQPGRDHSDLFLISDVFCLTFAAFFLSVTLVTEAPLPPPKKSPIKSVQPHLSESRLLVVSSS